MIIKKLSDKKYGRKSFLFSLLRKGQAEFFGLVIIVFLLSMGMIFMISLKSNKDEASIKSSYLDQKLAENTLNALLNMRTDCKLGLSTGIKLSQLITDCADTQQMNCAFGEGSCSYLNRTITKIFNQTLKTWKKPYYFYIRPIEVTNINVSFMGCNNDVEAETPGKQPFPTRSGTGLIYLRLCK